MAVWALLHAGREVVAFRCVRSDMCREDVENEAVELGYAAKLPHGFALVRDAEIVCYEDDD